MAQRNYVTTYYNNRIIIRVNRAQHERSCIPMAVRHLLENSYNATHCEVVNEKTGLLLADVRHTVLGIKVTVK